MSSAKIVKVLFLILIGATSVSSVSLVSVASAAQQGRVIMDIPVFGGGSAGLGSLAVAVFFSVGDSSGVGAFSGTLQISGIEQEFDGLFMLTVNNPANAPVLHCTNGQVSAGGTVVSGSFLNDQVIVAGCIGSSVPGAFLSGTAELPGNDFSATGTGTTTLASMPHLQGDVAASGVTSGVGTAGPGNIYTAEAGGIISNGILFGGGALVGSVSDINTGSVWQINKVSSPSACTLTSSGVTGSFGSFPNQPVSSTYTLVTCPPASIGPQPARFVYVVGSDANPIYKGTGSAITTVQTRGSTF